MLPSFLELLAGKYYRNEILYMHEPVHSQFTNLIPAVF